MDEVQITFLTTPELLEQKFHKAAPLLQDVVDGAVRGEFTVQDIERLAQAGKAVVCVIEKDGKAVLAAAFEFVHYPRKRAINIMAMAGVGLHEAQVLFWDAFNDWARGAGVACIEASCSRAMARLLGRFGFEDVYRVVRHYL